MKRLALSVVVLALSVAGTLGAQQKFSSLPIGYNIGNYVNRILVEIGSRHTSTKWTQSTFEYNWQKDGSLETFAEQRLQEIATRFTPTAGEEQLAYMWGIAAYTDGIGGLLPTYNGGTKPAHIASAPGGEEYVNLYENGFHLTLRNGRWEVPEEVFGKVKFQWPAAVGYTIPAWNLKVDVSDSKGRIARFAARERIQEEGNPCALPVILMGLNTGGVLIPEEIATAQPSWWERAEITLETEDGASVTFVVNRTERDGTAVRWSNPPPSFFAPPTPKIASLQRVGNLTEITVEGNGTVTLEFSENFREWKETGSRIVLAGANAQRVLRDESVVPVRYYRLRIHSGAQ